MGGRQRRCLCPHPVACCFKSGSGSLIRLSQQSLRELTIRTEQELNTHTYSQTWVTLFLTSHIKTQPHSHYLSHRHPGPHKFYMSLPIHGKGFTHTHTHTHTLSPFYTCLDKLKNKRICKRAELIS